ncbi:MAG: hypothetical protein ABS903_16945 [Solibacillus sp.]
MITVGYNYLLPPLIGIFDELGYYFRATAEEICPEMLARRWHDNCM